MPVAAASRPVETMASLGMWQLPSASTPGRNGVPGAAGGCTAASAAHPEHACIPLWASLVPGPLSSRYLLQGDGNLLPGFRDLEFSTIIISYCCLNCPGLSVLVFWCQCRKMCLSDTWCCIWDFRSMDLMSEVSSVAPKMYLATELTLWELCVFWAQTAILWNR